MATGKVSFFRLRGGHCRNFCSPYGESRNVQQAVLQHSNIYKMQMKSKTGVLSATGDIGVLYVSCLKEWISFIKRCWFGCITVSNEKGKCQ